MTKSPVLCIIFNRPDTTRRVFEAVRSAQPSKLFICAEGPRKDRPEDILLCKQTRDIYNSIDWDCEVHRLFRETNSGGCGPGVSGAINWFFEHVEEGIILEDDIVPHPDFFRFCDEMLDRYRDKKMVKCIGGFSRFYETIDNYPYSYYFSCFFPVWGWATWRRTWEEYDYTLKSVKKEKLEGLVSKLSIPKGCKKEVFRIFETMTSDTPIDTWDFQMYLSILYHQGVNIIPMVNLCQNIGFGREDATHTKRNDSSVSNHQGQPIYVLKHPTKIESNKALDKITGKYHSCGVSLKQQLKSMVKNYLFRIIHV